MAWKLVSRPLHLHFCPSDPQKGPRQIDHDSSLHNDPRVSLSDSHHLSAHRSEWQWLPKLITFWRIWHSMKKERYIIIIIINIMIIILIVILLSSSSSSSSPLLLLLSLSLSLSWSLSLPWSLSLSVSLSSFLLFYYYNHHHDYHYHYHYHCHYMYPLVNVYITMENHHFQWENPLFLWPFSIANC